jgi:hypothetical protein
MALLIVSKSDADVPSDALPVAVTKPSPRTLNSAVELRVSSIRL